MGSWSVYCQISQIAITKGVECLLLPLKRNRCFVDGGYADWIPAMLPIRGKYYDSGYVRDIVHDDNVKLIESHFGIPIEDFCDCFTSYDDNPEVKDNVEEIKDWNFCYIRADVYDFCKDYKHWNFDIKIGSKPALKILNATDITSNSCNVNGVKFKISRHEKLCPDSLDVEDSRNIISSVDELAAFVNISQDIVDLLKLPKVKLWRHYKECGIYELSKLLCPWLNPFDIFKGFGWFEDDGQLKYRDTDSIVVHYYNLETCDMFLDDIVDLRLVGFNIKNMSMFFSPHIDRAAPQCGEHENHLKLLEKFAEIVKKEISSYNGEG